MKEMYLIVVLHGDFFGNSLISPATPSSKTRNTFPWKPYLL